MKIKCIDPDNETFRRFSPQEIKRFYIIDGIYEAVGICEIEIFSIKFEILVMNNDFPTRADGILGKDWQIQTKSIINNEDNTITLKNSKRNTVTLELNKHQLAQLQPNSFEVRNIKPKNRPGVYYIEGLNIIPGIYEIKDGQDLKLYLFNQTDEFKPIYRENISVTTHNEDETPLIDGVGISTDASNTQSKSSNSLRNILNNRLNHEERKILLQEYYKGRTINDSVNRSEKHSELMNSFKSAFHKDLNSVSEKISPDESKEISHISYSVSESIEHRKRIDFLEKNLVMI